jgi:hypothetical protein
MSTNQSWKARACACLFSHSQSYSGSVVDTIDKNVQPASPPIAAYDVQGCVSSLLQCAIQNDEAWLPSHHHCNNVGYEVLCDLWFSHILNLFAIIQVGGCSGTAPVTVLQLKHLFVTFWYGSDAGGSTCTGCYRNNWLGQ